jgi:hypothetical protein
MGPLCFGRFTAPLNRYFPRWDQHRQRRRTESRPPFAHGRLSWRPLSFGPWAQEPLPVTEDNLSWARGVPSKRAKYREPGRRGDGGRCTLQKGQLLRSEIWNSSRTWPLARLVRFGSEAATRSNRRRGCFTPESCRGHSRSARQLRARSGLDAVGSVGLRCGEGHMVAVVAEFVRSSVAASLHRRLRSGFA